MDLLSSLPEHLQDEILKRLDLREAARASAISRVWRRRWETLPGLALSFPGGGMPASAVGFVLRRYTAGPSVSQLSCYLDAHASQSQVDDWLLALSHRRIESISIFGKRADYFTVYSSSFPCDCLVSLTLERFCFRPCPQPAGGFVALSVLKELYLKFVHFGKSRFQAMIRASPMLRVLLLENVSPMLRVLLLEDAYAIAIDGSTDCVIELPNLHTLGLITWGWISSSTYWRFGELPRLQYACIDGTHDLQREPAGFLECLAGVSQAQELTFKLPRFVQIDVIPFTFSNLKSMELSTVFDKMHRISLIFCLLRSSPNLENLKIEVRRSKYKIVNHEFLNSQWTDGMCGNLRVVQITSYKGWLPLFFIECILSKAPCLRTLSVDVCPVSQDDRFNVLLSCRRASPHAQVLFKVQLEKISFNRTRFAEKRLN